MFTFDDGAVNLRSYHDMLEFSTENKLRFNFKMITLGNKREVDKRQ
jgi:hypothetical protein